MILSVYLHFNGWSSAIPFNVSDPRDYRNTGPTPVSVCIPTDPRDHRCETRPPVCIPTDPRDHRCETPRPVAPPVGGSTQHVLPVGNLELMVSGDVNPYIVWTSPSSTSKQKVSIFFDAKVTDLRQPITGLAWKGCKIWKEEYMRGTEIVPGHWERMRVGELEMSQHLWTQSLTDPSIYKSKIDGYFPVGSTTFFCEVTTNRGWTLQSSIAPFTVKVAVDDIPPTIITPTAIIEKANSANGIVIEYAVNGTDNSGEPLEVKCDPSSGSLFPIGKTSVTCNATDKFGNSIKKIFTVEVIGQVSLPGEGNAECNELNIRDITASGFETDPSDYHPPLDAIDKDSSTWWANKDKNSWILIDLGTVNTFCELSVEWNKGETRKYTFSIGVSENGIDFEQVFHGANKLGSSSLEVYPIEDTRGEYIKIQITGTSSKQGWVSIKEIKVTGGPNA